MTKVAIFTNSLSGGGMERAMLNVASYLQSQGAQVDFLVASSKGSLLKEMPKSINLVDLKSLNNKCESIRWWLFKAAIRVEPMFLFLMFIYKLPKSIKVIPKLVEYMRSNSPDIILSTPTTANLAVLWAARFSGYKKKVIVREATTLSQEIKHNNSQFFKYVKKLVAKWYPCANEVICVSEGVRKDLQEIFMVHKASLKVVQNIVDIKGIDKKSKSTEHKQLIDDYKPYVLSVGRLDKSKDFETLIKAYQLISNQSSCNLVILGEGNERKRLERMIEEMSLMDRVFLPGFLVNPYPLIKNCEVFSLSSRWEGAPNVLREALLLNRKIISTDCSSAIREILADGKYGDIVPVGDYKLYSKHLLELINEVESKRNISEQDINATSLSDYRSLCLGEK